MPPLALLAGGLATRLRPLSDSTPKSLVAVAGEPFISHQLRLLARQNVQRVVLCTGFLGHAIRDVVGDGSRFGLSVVYSPDGPTPLGTGGALKQALPLLGDEFVVMYGDSYLLAPIASVLHCFRAQKLPCLMTVYRNENRVDRSNVVFRDGLILAYDKQSVASQSRYSDMVYIDYGLTVMCGKALAEWPLGCPFDLAVVFRRLLDKGQLAAYEVFERFYEIGSLGGLEETDRFLRGKLKSDHA